MSDKPSEPLEFAQDLAEFSLQSRRAGDAARPAERAAEEWFARSLGLDFGPMPWNDLVDMAARGVISSSDSVRCGTAGAWVAAGDLLELAAAFPSAGSALTAGAGTDASVGGSAAESTRAAADVSASPPAARSMRTIALVGVAGLLFVACAAWMLFLREPGDAGRLAQLRELHREMSSLRERRAPEAEWTALTEKVKQDVLPWVESRRRSQQSLSPAGKELYAAARDNLLPMLGESRRAPKAQEEEFLRRLEEAERRLAEGR